jgi:hypothetical protein
MYIGAAVAISLFSFSVYTPSFYAEGTPRPTLKQVDEDLIAPLHPNEPRAKTAVTNARLQQIVSVGTEVG